MNIDRASRMMGSNDSLRSSSSAPETPILTPQPTHFTTSHKVAVKIALLDDHPLDDAVSESSGRYTREQARSAVLNEINLFSSHLVPLQGVVVPRFYGAWVGQYEESEVYLCVMQQLGQPVASDWSRIRGSDE
jgi:hypothetical protein